MKYSDEFDGLLHDALAEYRDAAPLRGMEERVLQRVQLRTDRPRLSLGRIVAAIAVAMIAVAMWIGWHSRVRQGSPMTMTQTSQKTPSIASQPQNVRRSESVIVSKRQRDPRDPRGQEPAQLAYTKPEAVPQQFPMPAPLTMQERTLLELANANPQALRILATNKEEIVIDPIVIKPLSGPEGEN
jgi:hypothetical protein